MLSHLSRSIREKSLDSSVLGAAFKRCEQGRWWEAWFSDSFSSFVWTLLPCQDLLYRPYRRLPVSIFMQCATSLVKPTKQIRWIMSFCGAEDGLWEVKRLQVAHAVQMGQAFLFFL